MMNFSAQSGYPWRAGSQAQLPAGFPCRPLAIGMVLAALAVSASAIAQNAPSSAPEASHAPVQPIELEAAPPAKSTLQRKSKYEISVDGGDWQATGVPLLTGDEVKFHASGSMILSDGHTSDPAGVARGWKDLLRLYPVSSANSGALVGRIGDSSAALPFSIGADDTLTVPADGQLYLRANVSPDLTADGSYKVKIEVHPPKAGNSGATAEDSRNFAQELSPALFASIPRRVTDQQGDPGDMVNFALIGTQQQVKDALARAGWFPTDANPQDALIHGLLETLEHKSYMAVPMSTLYLFGRPQDMAYARANAIEVAATRNHLRLWLSPEKVGGVPMWVGSATHDHGFETDQRTGGITHHIDPDIDQERDFILHSLNDAGAVQAAAYVLPSNPVSTARTATGGSFNSDGRIVVLQLR